MDLPAQTVETAQRLVDECQARVAGQAAHIADLTRERRSTAEAQVLLATMENRLRALQENLARLKARVARSRPVSL